MPDITTEPIVRATDQVAAAAEHALDDRPSAEAVPPAGTVPAPVAVRRGRTASGVVIGGTIGFLATFAVVRAGRTHAFDLAATRWLQRHDRPNS